MMPWRRHLLSEKPRKPLIPIKDCYESQGRDSESHELSGPTTTLQYRARPVGETKLEQNSAAGRPSCAAAPARLAIIRPGPRSKGLMDSKRRSCRSARATKS